MSEQTVYGADRLLRDPCRASKVRTHHLQKWKAEGHKWAMLTVYDYSTARVFDDAGIPVLLVGDSAANVVYGYDTTVPVTIDELIPLVRGVVRGAPHALVVADLPFGSYEAGAQQALATATRFMKETGAHAVKLEGGERVAEQIAAITAAGIPVMAHIGFTPQSVNGLGGFRVQGPWRCRRADHPRRDRRARGRRVRRGDGDGARRAGHPDHRQADHPHHRHRRRARTAMRRCWSGRTWPGSPAARPPSSSSGSATSEAYYAAQQRNTPTRWPAAHSPPKSIPSRRTRPYASPGTRRCLRGRRPIRRARRSAVPRTPSALRARWRMSIAAAL